MKLVVISSKRYHSDFRKYLVEAAESDGDLAYHVHCWESLNVTHQGVESPDQVLDIDNELLRCMAVKLGYGHDTVVLTGMTSFRSRLAKRMRNILPQAIFVYDVYDDFRYGTKGFKRLRRLQRDLSWRLHCDKQMVLEQGLLTRYPRAFHLDNASHMWPLVREWKAIKDEIVYIGSIDVRTDFFCLEQFARAGVGIAIWGRPHSQLPQGQELIDTLCNRYPHVRYMGGYVNDDLPTILRCYKIGLLPYKVNSEWTRHINPDKLYHYLNSGLEVVSTRIPQAERMAPYINLVDEEFNPVMVIDHALRYSKSKKWPLKDFQWLKRWHQLQAYIKNDGECA